MTSVAQDFRLCFAVISNPKRVCKRARARDVEGRRCLPSSRDAKSWCSLGIVTASTTDPNNDRKIRAALVRGVARHYPDDFAMSQNAVANFHDQHEHAEIVELWRLVGVDEKWLKLEPSMFLDPPPPNGVA